MSSDTAASDRPVQRELADRGLRVLLVDDSSFAQAVGKHFLESLGCAVDVVGNGEDGIARRADDTRQRALKQSTNHRNSASPRCDSIQVAVRGVDYEFGGCSRA